MNICIVSVNKITPKSGGIERVSFNLMSQFRAMGHSVSSIYFRGNNYDDDDCSIRLPDIDDIKANSNLLFLKDKLREIDIILDLSFSYDLSLLCYKAKQKSNTKIVYAFHTHYLIASRSLFDYIDCIKYSEKNVIKRFLLTAYHYLMLPFKLSKIKRENVNTFNSYYKMVDAYVLLSEYYKAPFIKYTKIKDANKKLFAINNPSPFVNEIAIKQNKILYVGRLEFIPKRLDRLFLVWQRIQNLLPNWDLVIVGDGANSGRLKRMAKDMMLERVYFEGQQNPTKYYLDSKVLCLTSTFEGLPMTAIEAQQCGCVPIAFESFEAVHDIIEDGENGVLVKPFKIKEYANKLIALCNDETRREKMSLNGMQSVKKFDSKIIAEQWIELFNKLIDNDKTI